MKPMLEEVPRDEAIEAALAAVAGLSLDEADTILDRVIAHECSCAKENLPRHGQPIPIGPGRTLARSSQLHELLVRAKGVLIYDDEHSKTAEQRQAAVYRVALERVRGVGYFCVERRILARTPVYSGWLQAGVPGLERIILLGDPSNWAEIEALLVGFPFSAENDTRSLFRAIVLARAVAQVSNGSWAPGPLGWYGGDGAGSRTRGDIARRKYWLSSEEFTSWLLHPGIVTQGETRDLGAAAMLLLRLHIASWQTKRRDLVYAGYPLLASAVQWIMDQGGPTYELTVQAFRDAEAIIHRARQEEVYGPRSDILKRWLGGQAGPWRQHRHVPAFNQATELRELMDADPALQRELSQLEDRRCERTLEGWRTRFVDPEHTDADAVRGKLLAWLRERSTKQPSRKVWDYL